VIVAASTPLQHMPVSQGRMFWNLRWRIIRNAGSLLFGNSRVRLISMVLASAIICAALYAGASFGFRLIARSALNPTSGIIGLIFSAMFFALGIMLVISSGLILYASLFTGAEAKFLLATPARADQIFATKFQGAVVFSSWAFLVLGGPILLAYGVRFNVPWYYYALLPVYFLAYVILPAAVGAIFCLLIVNYFPRRRKQAFTAMIVLAIIGAAYWIYRLISIGLLRRRSIAAEHKALEQVFDMFALAQGQFAPSRWLSRSLMAIARGDLSAALMPTLLLWSHALLLYLLAAYLAKKLYRRGFNRLSENASSRRIYGTSRLDRLMNFFVCYLDKKTRLLIVKDFRTFRREPAQVGQLALFAGLMLLCVINIRSFFGADLPLINQYVVSLLNLSATGLLMCAYLGRFVYPLISLEGRKFWILGLLPLKREQLLWGKFAFAVTMALVLAGGIVLLSDVVLEMQVSAIAIHLFTVAVLSFGLSGLSVGMSAWMPNFRETDPSKIVVGFGGTMFTIASLGYLILAVGAICGPYHAAGARGLFARDEGYPLWAFVGVPLGLLMAVLAVWLPMRVGARTLRRMEF
jgi:ABC-2 type transport system permease protein